MNQNHTKLNQIDFAVLEREIDSRFESLKTRQDLELVRRDWLAKEGILKSLFQQLRDVPPEDKPRFAAALNQIKTKLETQVEQAEARFAREQEETKVKSEFLDLSLPSFGTGCGAIHPITAVERKISSILRPFGFRNVPGPEVETEYYCFDSLNIPPHHPARDMQDTFYLDLPRASAAREGLDTARYLLRTHTTSVQARTLKEGGLPVKVASFGRVYRNETEDPSHQAMFHQFELVWLDKGLTLSHLMALIVHILKGLYGKRRKVKFVPKFYPYTEPSIGPQIDCSICHGSGCPACGGCGWVTIAGAGMVHRNVLKEFDYDPGEVSGFAFGLGTSRLACQQCSLPNLKIAYDNDLRVLRQFV